MKVILTTGLLSTTPILLAALGGAINREAGIVNIGLDGMMLAGAFVAVFVDWKTGSPLLACLAATATGAAVGYVFALPITRLGANEIVAGLGLALLMPGLFGYILPVAFGQASTLQPAGIPGVGGWHIPLLSKIPFVGSVVFSQDPITYISWLAIPLTWFLLYRTVLGVRLRAAGHNPDAAVAAGLPLVGLRELATAIAGLMAALGGAQLTLATVQLFSKDMTAGRGFIALAAVIFGRWTPLGATGAALFFGFFAALQYSLQRAGVPSELMQALPYLAALVALAGFAGRVRAPAADGIPFVRS